MDPETPKGKNRGKGFLAYLFRPSHIILVIGILVLVQFFEHWGWFDTWEAAWLDSFYILGRAEAPAKVVIVDITEDDYRDIFKATSPLDRKKLRDLIDTVSALEPSVIGVDIDTSAPAFAKIKPEPGWRPVIWSMSARPKAEAHGPTGSSVAKTVLNPFHKEELELVPDPVLGAAWSPDVSAAVGLLPVEPDGVVRRYYRSFRLAGSDRALPAIPAAIAAASGAAPQNRPESAGPFLIRFANAVFPRVPASFVLHAGSEHRRRPDQPWPQLMERMRGRIVMIGGTYAAARDSFTTPRGAMPGVDLLASAVETELKGGGMSPVARALTIALDLALAVLLIFFGYCLKTGHMLALGALVIVLITVLSFLAFSNGLFWLNTVPLLAGVLLHQWGHRIHQHRRTKT